MKKTLVHKHLPFLIVEDSLLGVKEYTKRASSGLVGYYNTDA